LNINAVSAYELIEKREVTELHSEGYLLKHKKSGARIFILENDDENKVFYIGFRTPPSDSTGVPHIMEHSVLCGSKLFPAKDPFVELAKGSMNTFLNAMTYPDKTVYPVASCNDQDFKNLMHVYMDAVLHPNIYSRPQIFKQEGWHYELFEPDGDITINGVVYNEMKGAFSSPDDVVDRHMYEVLYPDTAYSLESGGDPEDIPSLTYEQFKEFHQKYYHPCNSYIYLYGNCDMEERLRWLDEEYLSSYEAIELNSEIGMQKPFESLAEKEFSYAIADEESEQNNTFLNMSWVLDTALNRELYLAFDILDYALLSSPGAPLEQAVLREGIGSDVISTYENGILQPYYSIMVKNANETDRDAFVKVVRDTLSRLAETGIDKKALEAGINHFEFKYREADFGSYPKGLMYGLQCLDSWLYDETNPFLHISATETIEFLKAQINEGYFEELIKKYLLDNKHGAIVVTKPEKHLNDKKDEELAKKLADYKASLNDEEVKNLIEDTKALKKYQEEPSTQEELKSIPMLKKEDIRKEAEAFCFEEIVKDGIKYIYHDIDTNGISYMTVSFDTTSVPQEYVPYLALFKRFLMLLSTKNYSYSELTNEINRKCGGINASIAIYRKSDDPEIFKPCLEIVSKFLIDKTDFVFDMIEEILFTTDFTDYDRIKEELQVLKSRMQMAFMTSGHSVAANRANTYYSNVACYSDYMTGLEFYKFVCELVDDFDARREDFATKMKEIFSYVVCKKGMLIDVAGSKESFDKVASRAAAFYEKLSDAENERVEYSYELSQKNEGLKCSARVQYVAMAGDFLKAGYEYTGALRVLKTILGYEYLWLNIRVKGGAYGCFGSFSKTGAAVLSSYRDPNLSETIEIYKRTADYIKDFEVSERDMTKYIIGTVSDMDVPLTPRMKALKNLGIYMSGVTFEELQQERDEVLGADQNSIRALSELVRAVVDQNNLCVVGSETKINENEALFGSIRNLM